MQTTPTRAQHAEHPPSTPGTPDRRARRWPLRAGVLAVGAIGLAAPMVAADPASAPVQPTTLTPAAARAVDAPTTTTTAKPGPTQAEIDRLNEAIWVHKTNERIWVEKTQARLAEEARRAEAARQEAARQEAARQEAARQQAARQAPPAAEQGSGRCGGDLPPCYVMMRESGGNIRAKNPHSTASGKWQFLNSTWAGYGGYAEAWMAPESVQDAKARQLWAGGAGCSHWSAC